jgi:hypothetical protein
MYQPKFRKGALVRLKNGILAPGPFADEHGWLWVVLGGWVDGRPARNMRYTCRSLASGITTNWGETSLEASDAT